MKKAKPIILRTIMVICAAGSLRPLVAEKSGAPYETDPYGSAKLIKRRVLIADFVNTQKLANYDYLTTTIPDSIFEPLEKTKSFDILARDKGSAAALTGEYANEIDGFDLATESTAAEVGRRTGAEVVIVGNFVVYSENGGDKIMFQAKAVETKTGRVRVARKRNGPLSSKIFQMISDLSDDMAGTMSRELPPVSVDEMKSLLATSYPIYMHVAGFSSLGLQNYKEIQTSEMGGRVDLSQRYLSDWIYPMLSTGGSITSGTSYITSLFFYFAEAGLSMPVRMNRLVFQPFLLGGMHGGKIASSAAAINFLVPSFEAGMHVDFLLSQKIGLTFTGSYVTLFDTVLPVSALRLGLGMVFKF